jgi:hypothetical protein
MSLAPKRRSLRRNRTSHPNLAEPVSTFIARYLASRETVLILPRPPGTGKTRLVG